MSDIDVARLVKELEENNANSREAFEGLKVILHASKLENESLSNINESLEAENTTLKSIIENLRERDKTLMSTVHILEQQNGDLESRVREFTLMYDERAGA